MRRAFANGRYRPSVTRMSSRLTAQMRKYSLPEPVKRISRTRGNRAGEATAGEAALRSDMRLPDGEGHRLARWAGRYCGGLGQRWQSPLLRAVGLGRQAFFTRGSPEAA